MSCDAAYKEIPYGAVTAVVDATVPVAATRDLGPAAAAMALEKPAEK